MLRQVRWRLRSPPRTPVRTDVPRSLTNRPQFAGFSAVQTRGGAVSAAAAGSRYRRFSAPGLWALQTRSWRRRLSGNAADQTDKPNIAYWRPHSAGASRRRVTPMPRGSRPSTAACTSRGARNVSEIVILTCRMLHCSRAALCSTLTAPATISSSERRPPRSVRVDSRRPK